MKEKLVEFLKPDKGKIILSLILPSFWLAVKLLIAGTYQPEDTQAAVITVSPSEDVSYLIKTISYLLEAVFYYPFSCALVTIFGYYRREELTKLVRNRALFGMVFIGILVFNSISLEIIVRTAFFGIAFLFLPEKTGLLVVEIYSDSPTTGFGGLEAGKVIYEINNEPVTNVGEAQNVLDSTEPGDHITLRYNGRKTEFILSDKVDSTRGYLGVKVRDAQGNEAVL